LLPWRARWIDFALWLWVLLSALFLVDSLVAPLLRHWPADSLAALVLGGLASQGAIFAAQLALLRFAPAQSPRPLDISVMSRRAAAGCGFRDFLMAVPIIFAVAMVWAGVLHVLKHFDPSLITPAQEPVLLFLHGGNPWLLGTLALLAIILAPVNEELFFRGGLYRFAKSRAHPTIALAASSLLFGLAHFNVRQFLPLVLIGALLVRTYERTGRILAPIVFHASFNTLNILLLIAVAHFDPSASLDQ
jgi:membrane protease YdiL (CAAX protease family)